VALYDEKFNLSLSGLRHTQRLYLNHHGHLTAYNVRALQKC
jgi:hypothetical protein